MNTIEISADRLLGVLKGRQDALDSVDGESLVVCDGINVAKVRPATDSDGWELEAIACDHPSHGVHPRYEEAAKLLAAQVAKVRERSGFIAPSKPCDKCDGNGWMEPASSGAQLSVILCGVVRMFRGIEIGAPGPDSGGLSPSAAADTINAFLSAGGMSRHVASPDPTASSPGSGRVNFSEAQRQQPQVKERIGHEREDAGDTHEAD